MTAHREELAAALAEAQARLNAASGGPWKRVGGFIDSPGNRIASVLYAGLSADTILIVAMHEREQRAINHGLDVLKRHHGFDPDSPWCAGCDAMPYAPLSTCPELLGQHRVWVTP